MYVCTNIPTYIHACMYIHKYDLLPPSPSIHHAHAPAMRSAMPGQSARFAPSFAIAESVFASSYTLNPKLLKHFTESVLASSHMRVCEHLCVEFVDPCMEGVHQLDDDTSVSKDVQETTKHSRKCGQVRIHPQHALRRPTMPQHNQNRTEEQARSKSRASKQTTNKQNR